jgi:hypothetical protein
MKRGTEAYYESLQKLTTDGDYFLREELYGYVDIPAAIQSTQHSETNCYDTAITGYLYPASKYMSG